MLSLHPKQEEIVRSLARFKVVRAGRRSGKTVLKMEILIFKAVTKKDRKVYFIANTQEQARGIIWELLKSRLANIGEYNEQRLEVKIPTEEGGTSLIKIGGWENRENQRGKPADHIEFDEVDTMRDFYIGWKEIYRPMLIDTKGTASFGGTPKKENPNLRRLEKEGQDKDEWESFHFTSKDNPFLPIEELYAIEDDYKDDKNTFRQEILAEYVDDLGSLFAYNALVDMFSNIVTKGESKYLTVDIGDDGADKTIFNYWHGLESYKIELFEGLRTDGIINHIRESASADRIPYSQIAVDAIGVGAGVASSPLLNGIISYKSSYQPIKNESSIVRLPNVHYRTDHSYESEFKNLRSQCVFKLAELVNNHEVACKSEDARVKSHLIEELATYQDASKGDGKRYATAKEDVKELIGRSPDISDTFMMRMFFVLKEGLTGTNSEDDVNLTREIANQFDRNRANLQYNSSK